MTINSIFCVVLGVNIFDCDKYLGEFPRKIEGMQVYNSSVSAHSDVIAPPLIDIEADSAHLEFPNNVKLHQCSKPAESEFSVSILRSEPYFSESQDMGFFELLQMSDAALDHV